MKGYKVMNKNVQQSHHRHYIKVGRPNRWRDAFHSQVSSISGRFGIPLFQTVLSTIKAAQHVKKAVISEPIFPVHGPQNSEVRKVK